MNRILAIVAVVLLLGACGSETEKRAFDPAEFESEMTKAIKQFGDKTELEIMHTEEREEGYSILLADDVIAIINEDEAKVGVTPLWFNMNREDAMNAYVMLVGAADQTLGYGDRYQVLSDLGVSENVDPKDAYESVTVNDVIYTFYDNDKTYVLSAETKPTTP